MEFLDALWKYLLSSAPYLLFGLTISGAIHQFITVEKITKWLGGNSLWNVIKAAILGIPLPLCSCSVIPTAVTLRKSGASKASTSSFLIATPESGVDSISITYALMDLPMTILRPVAAFCSAFLAGLLQLIFNKEVENNEDENEAMEESKCCCKKACSSKAVEKKNLLGQIKEMFAYGFGKLTNDISLWLAIGLLAGALIDYLVPDNFFTTLTATQSRFAILLIGVPLYICATASTPIAVSLMMKGMSPGVGLILLLVGPATNISNIAVLQKYIGKKGVFLNVTSIIFVALAFSYLVDYLYIHHFKMSFAQSLQGHEHHHVAWWETLSAVVLVILILKGIYFEEIQPRLKKSNSKGHCH